MNLSRLITGGILILGGIVLVVVAVVSNLSEGGIVALIYGVPAFIIGIFILLNDKEDKIEQIKRRKAK